MRFGLCLALMIGVTSAHAADSPTADEQKAIDTIAKLGGKGEIDPELAPGARVAAVFPALNDIQLTNLKKMLAIGSIRIDDCRRATDKGVAQLAGLPNLRGLRLGKTLATDRFAAAAAECDQLRVLYLGEGRLTDAGLLPLKKLTKLEVLDVSNNPTITDKGMATIATFGRLEQLYLGSTAITDKGLEQLRSLEGLIRLNVTNTKINTAAAEKFEREMPNLRQVRR